MAFARTQPARLRLRASSRVAARLIAAFAALAATCAAEAYGPLGHVAAARIAEPRLCRDARAEIDRLTRGEPFTELGLWADRVRNTDRYRHSGPWHYMNLPDSASIDRYESPREGDVLSSIERFRAVLADSSASRAARADALRFLIHFVVDIHQPLHVGRAEDRGGNEVDVRFRGRRVNLHRFWDTEAVELVGGSMRELVFELERARPSAEAASDEDPRAWAAESLALRALVYSFSNPTLGPDYLDRARRITRERLSLAGLRLAATLNALYCEPA